MKTKIENMKENLKTFILPSNENLTLFQPKSPISDCWAHSQSRVSVDQIL
jgi:hypothetical protein